MKQDDNGVRGLIEIGAQRFAGRIALGGDRPSDTPIYYQDIAKLCQSAKATLNDLGVPEGGVVVLVADRGVVAAGLSLAISTHFTLAPLSSNLRPDELRGRLGALRPMMVFFEVGCSGELIDAALKCKVPVFSIGISRAQPPSLAIEPLGDMMPAPAREGRSMAGGGLMLSTSGTTGTPKLVPLQGQKMVRSARNICDGLELQQADSTMILMPLFHIHGLIAGLLAPLLAGACVTVMSRVEPLAFLELAGRIKARWYTGVPTLHAAIVRAALEDPERARACEFRFIRSSSSPLPLKIRRDLESVFRAPVLEAYGMTEACHQISSQSIGVQARVGCVGIPPKDTVRILDEAGAQVAVSETGEIAIRGANVMDGYLDNPRANHETFVGDWMRTGDIGRLLPDGSLLLIARKKEIIKRAANQVAPAEVENALLDLPGVDEAVVFGVDHATIGQDLVAAVVLRAGADFCEHKARSLLLDRLSPHKVPSRIIPVAAIPCGPTGKPKRIGLQYDLARDLVAAYVAPETSTQEILCDMFGEVLDCAAPVGIGGNFFLLGGDSLSAVRLINRINQRFSRDLAAEGVFLFSTVAQLATYLEKP